MVKPKAKARDESFEKLFSELEETVAKLEAGDLALEDSLALFQRGTELAKKCAALLDRAELRVKELSPGGEEIELEDLEQDE